MNILIAYTRNSVQQRIFTKQASVKKFLNIEICFSKDAFYAKFININEDTYMRT